MSTSTDNNKLIDKVGEQTAENIVKPNPRLYPGEADVREACRVLALASLDTDALKSVQTGAGPDTRIKFTAYMLLEDENNDSNFTTVSFITKRGPSKNMI